MILQEVNNLIEKTDIEYVKKYKSQIIKIVLKKLYPLYYPEWNDSPITKDQFLKNIDWDDIDIDRHEDDSVDIYFNNLNNMFTDHGMIVRIENDKVIDVFL